MHRFSQAIVVLSLTCAVLAFAVPAFAGSSTNGITINGKSFNGVDFQGTESLGSAPDRSVHRTADRGFDTGAVVIDAIVFPEAK